MSKRKATDEKDNESKNKLRPPEPKMSKKEHLSLNTQKKKHQTELKIWKNINLLVIGEK